MTTSETGQINGSPEPQVNNGPDLTEAMRRADEADPSAESRALERQLEQTVEEGLKMAKAPIFTTHSTSLAREFEAKAKGYIDQIADLDRQISELQAQRTDYMLSYSMLSHGMQARERGQAS